MSRGMTTKTINQVITKKVDKWLESIEDEELRKICKRDVIVTGGSIASMLLGEEVNDFDLYFKEYETTVQLAVYYVQQFSKGRVATGIARENPMAMYVEELKDSHDRQRVRIVVRSAGIAGENEDTSGYRYFEMDSTEQQNSEGNAGDWVEGMYAEGEVSEEAQKEKPPFAPIFLSSNAITLRDDVQIILRFHGGPEAIHENFDFVHCMNYWTPKEGVVVNEESLLALMSKTLVYKGSLYPVCSVFRAKKFIERGWKINAGQYLKMCLQISKLDLENFQILEEQLTGVDVAYFSEVLAKARMKDEDGKPVDKIETAYLVEVINRMF